MSLHAPAQYNAVRALSLPVTSGHRGQRLWGAVPPDAAPRRPLHFDLPTRQLPNIEMEARKPLKGAEFTLQYSGTTYDGGPQTTNENGEITWSGIPAGQSYTLTETKAPAGYLAPIESVTVTIDAKAADEVDALTTDANGIIDGYKGVEAGTYYLEETAAPAGYNMLAEDVEVTIDGTTDAAPQVALKEVTVENSTGALLPATGGIGTTIFTVVGGILMAGAAVLYITKKRSEDSTR